MDNPQGMIIKNGFMIMAGYGDRVIIVHKHGGEVGRGYTRKEICNEMKDTQKAISCDRLPKNALEHWLDVLREALKVINNNPQGDMQIDFEKKLKKIGAVKHTWRGKGAKRNNKGDEK